MLPFKSHQIQVQNSADSAYCRPIWKLIATKQRKMNVTGCDVDANADTEQEVRECKGFILGGHKG